MINDRSTNLFSGNERIFASAHDVEKFIDGDRRRIVRLRIETLEIDIDFTDLIHVGRRRRRRWWW